jgi:Holliday junction resolvase
MLEAFIQKTHIKNLKRLGYIVIRLRSTSEAGWPDVVALKNGVARFFEFKRENGGKVSKLQLLRKQQLELEGFSVDIIDSPHHNKKSS